MVLMPFLCMIFNVAIQYLQHNNDTVAFTLLVTLLSLLTALVDIGQDVHACFASKEPFWLPCVQSSPG